MASVSAQKITGKWFLTKEGDTFVIPENLILEISKDSINYFSFDKLVSANSLEIDGNKITIDQKGIMTFDFINDNRIKITYSDKKQNSSEYCRLTPTNTNLNPDEIEKLSFVFNWNDEVIKIKFNEELHESLNKATGQKDASTIKLEKIDSTYFASIYSFGKRTDVIPIKEVSTDKMILYGIPIEPYIIESKEKTEQE